jgi:hypothetical protein
MIYAKVIEDSVIDGASRLTTLELQYWRAIHGEFMTHRVFSRNAMSSRAIPVKKMLDMVRNDPARSLHWGKNQPGMQAQEELDFDSRLEAQRIWLMAAKSAANYAERLMDLGLHKQVANRLLEPFQWMRTIVTSTEWGNWNALRDHKDAEPNIRALAVTIKMAMKNSVPVERGTSTKSKPRPKSCHLPYVTDDEKATYGWFDCMKISAARCARVSYLTHDGNRPSLEADLGLYDRLVGSEPIHASPTEHQAMPKIHYATELPKGNLSSEWTQFRKMIEYPNKGNI